VNEGVAMQQYDKLKKQLRIHDSRRRGSDDFSITTNSESVLAQIPMTFIRTVTQTKPIAFDNRAAYKRLRKAFMEFYRGLLMLQNYKVLNRTGFAKILKKFDKTAKWKASELYLRKVDLSTLATSTTLDDIKGAVEETFIAHFGDGDRRKALAWLRIPESIRIVSPAALGRFGLTMGIALPLLWESLIHAFQDLPKNSALMQVYAALLIPILLLLLFCLNVYLWHIYRINYKFIFELDPRNHLTYSEFLEVPGWLFALYSLFTYLTFVHPFLEPSIYPAVFCSLVVIALVCPFKVLYHSARLWFLRTLGRIVSSGYHMVQFRDFFIADELSSLVYFIVTIQFMFCSYAHHWDTQGTCDYQHSWLTPTLGMLPALWRLLQCIRRYFENHLVFPHLVNGVKYLLTIITIWMAAVSKITGSDVAFGCWIVFLTLSTLHAYAWDILMDWGLLEKGSSNLLLRSELTYPPWFYYFAVVSNFVLRITWIINMSPNQYGLWLDFRVVAFTLAILEVYRRFQWNLIRMENEHINNCGMFRATKQIPLPYGVDTDEKEVDAGMVSRMTYDSDDE
jgi:hypothetical protein